LNFKSNLQARDPPLKHPNYKLFQDFLVFDRLIISSDIGTWKFKYLAYDVLLATSLEHDKINFRNNSIYILNLVKPWEQITWQCLPWNAFFGKKQSFKAKEIKKYQKIQNVNNWAFYDFVAAF